MEFLEYFLDKGMDPDLVISRDPEDSTQMFRALRFAVAFHYDIRTVELLLDEGAEVWLCEWPFLRAPDWQESLLWVAAENPHWEPSILDTLVDADADISRLAREPKNVLQDVSCSAGHLRKMLRLGIDAHSLVDEEEVGLKADLPRFPTHPSHPSRWMPGVNRWTSSSILSSP